MCRTPQLPACRADLASTKLGCGEEASCSPRVRIAPVRRGGRREATRSLRISAIGAPLVRPSTSEGGPGGKVAERTSPLSLTIVKENLELTSIRYAEDVELQAAKESGSRGGNIGTHPLDVVMLQVTTRELVEKSYLGAGGTHHWQISWVVPHEYCVGTILKDLLELSCCSLLVAGPELS